MALADAARICTLMDEESGGEDGYVTLVNSHEVNGEISE